MSAPVGDLAPAAVRLLLRDDSASSISTDAVMRRTRPAGFRTWRIFLLTAKVELSDFELWLSMAESTLETLGVTAVLPGALPAAPGTTGGPRAMARRAMERRA